MRQVLHIFGHAHVDVFHLAICKTCGGGRGQTLPFAQSQERDDWSRQHAASTGHPVDTGTEIRVITP